MYPATSELLLEHMKTIGGFARAGDAKRAARIVLSVFRERLDDAAAAAIARDLPEPLAAPMRGGAYRGDLAPDDLYAAVGDRERTSHGVGAEHAQIVLRAIGDALSDDTRVLLEKELPTAWTDLLFGDRETGEPPPHGAPKSGAKIRMTLASAHPGYRSPIAEASADRAQSDSVAKSDAPHEARKLSSARPK
jgi:uncharacterized protein (DUF2267 family)